MNQTEFLNVFSQVAGSYDWSYDNNNLTAKVTRGKFRGSTVNPITAVTLTTQSQYFPNTKRGTLQASRSIGISPQLALAVYSTSNRGHAQIVRGKLLDLV